MKRAVEKVHAAGLQTGIHTLTACINVRSDWITPVCDTNLVADAVYTLAQPLTPESKEIVVEEMPVKKHSTVFSYHSNGNVMRIGGELVQYSGIRRTKPYAFTGIKRGAFNTRKNEATIPAGSKIDYLHQRYVAFYPVPGSPLAEKLLGQLAHVYNYCNLDELYFDGSEGMGTRYGIDAMRHGLYSRLKANNGHSPTIEASCPGANNWWFQTRTATTDHAVYGIKRFHDWHIGWAVRRGRLCNFLEPQMGWWQPRLNVDLARGHFIDEMEYFAAKNAGHDASMSIQGVNKRPLPVGIRRQLTVLGWYEYARLARAFTREANAYLAEGENESRLRQDDGGVWRLTPAVADVHRAGLPWTREWTASKALPGKAALRIEALYGAGAAGSGVALLPEKDFAKMVQRAAPGVEAGIERSVSGRNGGKAIRISARNLAAEKNAAWVENRVAFDFPGLDVGAKRSAYGVWVNGDGSGAVLNFQLTSPSEYSGGISDHHLKLDFKGWRYVTFLLRERDADKYCRYSWPYFRSYLSVYRSMIKPAHIESVSFYLNGIEKGGTTTVEIGEVEALEMRSLTLKDAAVALNGKKFAVPFAMESGEYAELEEGRWTHYSAFGERLVSVPAAETPVLRADGNSMALTASDDARAEVTVFSFGAPMPALVGKMTPEMKKTMRFESMMPFEYAPEKGLLPPAFIPVRPGGKVRLGLEIHGPCENARFQFKRFFGIKKTVCVFPVKVSEDERLVCRDSVNWRLEKAKDGALVKEGRLERPLPVLGRTQRLDFSAEVPSGGVCTVDLIKEYAR
jgi:hypothetical protein